jgi:hypothetical protein
MATQHHFREPNVGSAAYCAVSSLGEPACARARLSRLAHVPSAIGMGIRFRFSDGSRGDPHGEARRSGERRHRIGVQMAWIASNADRGPARTGHRASPSSFASCAPSLIHRPHCAAAGAPSTARSAARRFLSVACVQSRVSKGQHRSRSPKPMLGRRRGRGETDPDRRIQIQVRSVASVLYVYPDTMPDIPTRRTRYQSSVQTRGARRGSGCGDRREGHK